MIKKLRTALDFWANPFRVMYRASMYREVKWKHYVNEIRELSKELDYPDVVEYCDHVLRQMNELVEKV